MGKIKSVLKFVIPVVIAGAMAMIDEVTNQKEAKRIDDMEERLNKLENSENDEEEES